MKTQGRNEAVLWDLSTQTVTNLHRKYLKAAGFRHTVALAIDGNGTIAGVGQRNKRLEAWALLPNVRKPRVPDPPTVVGGWVNPWQPLSIPGAILVALTGGAVLLTLRAKRRRPR